MRGRAVSAGPLRRLAATVGLVGLVPIAVPLATGALSAEAAAARAAAVVAVVFALGNLARVVLTSLLRGVEDPAPFRADDTGRGPDVDGRGTPHTRAR